MKLQGATSKSAAVEDGQWSKPVSPDQVRYARSWFLGIIVLAWIGLLTTMPFFGGRDFGSVVHIASVVFLCSVFGGWIALGRGVWRFPLALVGSLLVFAGFSFGMGRSNGVFLVLLFTQGIVVLTAVTGFVLRLLCGRLHQQGNMPQKFQMTEALQFSVRHVLIWTAVVAVLLTVVQAIERFGRPHQGELWMVASLATTFSAVAVIEIWALLGRQVSMLRAIVLVAALVSAAWINGLIVTGGKDVWWILVTVLSQLLTVMTVVSLRMQGYRFVRYIPLDGVAQQNY